eukprot:1180229-Prorocentrum_minimum.AAC.9
MQKVTTKVASAFFVGFVRSEERAEGVQKGSRGGPEGGCGVLSGLRAFGCFYSGFIVYLSRQVTTTTREFTAPTRDFTSLPLPANSPHRTCP